jgi:hypothetical protein
VGLEVLVPFVMGALLKVIDRVAEGALGAVEGATKDGAAAVFGKLKAWWSADRSAAEDLEKFAAEPDIYQPVVEARLVKKLEAEPDMQAEFATMMEQAGPQVEVFQKLAEAKGITGARVAKMVSGRLNVKQEIEHGKNIVGVDIDQLGL